MSGNFPNTYYRVSIKALIRNDKGHVLVVKENAQFWSLPGGGLDHGELIHDSLVRELYEEAMIDVPFKEKILTTKSIWLEHKKTWLLWVVCDIDFDGDYKVGVGEDTSEVAFIDPASFENGKLEEHLIYELCQQFSKK